MQAQQFQLHANIEEKHWWFVARRRLMQAVLEQLVPPARAGRSLDQATVIDVGCGTGANIAALADRYHAVGIDASPEAIRFAVERYPNVDFRAGFAPDDLSDCLPQARAVMMMDVLEHVSDDFQLLSSVMAAAAPGTFFLLTVPADLALWSPHDESFGHYRRYDANRFRQLWKDLPVTERMLTPFNTRLYPLIRFIRSWNRRRTRSTGEVGTDFNVPRPWTNAALRWIFAGERRRLLRSLNRDKRQGNLSSLGGVSLMAVLERREGPLEVQAKPAEAVDYFDPVAGQLIGAIG